LLHSWALGLHAAVVLVTDGVRLVRQLPQRVSQFARAPPGRADYVAKVGNFDIEKNRRLLREGDPRLDPAMRASTEVIT
jgi:hypothetical protein